MDDIALNALGGLCLGVADALVEAVGTATGLGPASAAALVTIDARPGLSVSSLAETLGTTHSGTVRIVDRLQSAALVTRLGGPDGRTAALHVTALGREECSQAMLARRTVLEELTEGLDPSERGQLEHLVLQMAPGLASTRTEARHACRLCEHAICAGDDCPIGGHL